MGETSARSVLGHTVDWAHWHPGNPAAARQLIGGAQALQDLLDHYGVATIRSIAASRMGDLAGSLAAALRDGTSVDELARELREVLDDEARAEMVARTEVARAQSQASMDAYRRADVRRVEWLTSPGNVCMQCEANADQGPISIRQVFQGGVDSPPQHPQCRCALMPVLDYTVE